MIPGEGPLSDGIPEVLGDGGESERVMPPPPRPSRRVRIATPTPNMRKAMP